MNLLTDVIKPIFENTLTQILPLFPYVIFLGTVTLVAFIIFNCNYKKGSYYKVTHNPYLTIRSDLGKYGEYLIYKYLRYLEKNGGKFLFNLYIPKENGETSEIDVILICKKGLFVFESKNYSGWIFGSEDQPKWTQTLPRGRSKSQKEHFYNPIMQNKAHIKHLRAIVGDSVPLHSVIVFSNRCILKNITAGDSNVPVINRRDAAGTVFRMLSKTDAELTDEKMEELYAMLYPYSQTDSAVKAEHISRIKEKAESSKTESAKPAQTVNPKTEEIENSLICPRCGSKLILRTAKRGTNAGKQFYGCSKYPQCKYTRDV